jgi:RimJ/RimL family protein N-acetyltransferase
LLKGRNVNVRVMERDDVEFLAETDRTDYYGEYDPIPAQLSKTERLRQFDNPSQLAVLTERQRFIIEKKDRARIGFIAHWFVQPNRMMGIGYHLIPDERGKGYGTEAVQIMVDYLFLTKDIVRLQAITNAKNVASQRVLEKAGFRREGTLRKSGFIRGEWVDVYLYGILREDWKEPKILK